MCPKKRRINQLKLAELNRDLKELERKHKSELKPKINIQLNILRNKTDVIYLQEIQKNMMYTKPKYYVRLLVYKKNAYNSRLLNIRASDFF